MDTSGAVDIGREVTMSMGELLSQYDVVHTDGTIMQVTDKGSLQLAEKRSKVDLREIGSSQASPYGDINLDYNFELRGRQGLEVYERMRKSDGQVRMSLRFLKTPVLAGRWYIEPFDDTPKSKKIAEFVWNNLNDDMSESFPQFLLESLNMLDFGFYMFEKVFKREDGKVKWKKFAPRHPRDWYEWEFDANGGVNAAWFYGPKGFKDSRRIPIEKMLVFTFDKENGDMCGTSVLRSAHKHWYFKDVLYKIDGIQKERHGIGIPIIKLPPGFTDDDRDIANELGRNLRTNERAHVTLPPMWDLFFVKLEGQPVDCMTSIEHHDRMIAHNVMLGDSSSNSTQESEGKEQLFLKNARFVSEIQRAVLNKFAIPELVQWNFGVTKYPKLRVRRIGDTIDWRALSFAARNFVGAQILRPDDRLEEWVRDEMDLPRADVDTVRETQTKQNPNTGQAPFNQNGSGKPKQAVAQNMDKTPGSSKVGRDGGSPGS